MSLKSIRVIESRSKINIVSKDGIPPLEPAIAAGFGMTEECQVLSNVHVTVETPPQKDDGEPPRSSVSIMVVFQCVFDTEDVPMGRLDIPEEDQTAIKHMSTFIEWPDVRQHVQAASLSLGLPAITLPLMRPHSLQPAK